MTAHDLLQADRFATGLGARLVEAGPTRVVVDMEVAARHRDGAGHVSAGALFSLADCALSLISNQAGTAVAVATHFVPAVGAVEADRVWAVARPALPVRDRTATWVIELVADGEEAVGSFTGTTLYIDR